MTSIEKRLAHIELALQRMPGMIAVAIVSEQERAQDARAMGRKYTDLPEVVSFVEDETRLCASAYQELSELLEAEN